MTREELEKMFDDRFKGCYINKGDGGYVCDIYIKQFIFETIIPEVLNNVVINKEGKIINIDAVVNIKQKAKEKFNIDL